MVDDLADPKASPDPLPFLIAGTPRGDVARVFDFEVMQRLPEGVEVFLEVPLAVLGQITVRRRWKVEVDRKRGMARLQLPAVQASDCVAFSFLPAAGSRLGSSSSGRRRPRSLATRWRFVSCLREKKLDGSLGRSSDGAAGGTG